MPSKHLYAVLCNSAALRDSPVPAQVEWDCVFVGILSLNFIEMFLNLPVDNFCSKSVNPGNPKAAQGSRPVHQGLEGNTAALCH